jgi:hypothetical protein
MSARPLLLLPFFLAGSLFAGPATIDFSSLGTSQIAFGGSSGSIQFLPDSSGYDFQIVDSPGLPGLVGLDGNITGTFSIGTITSIPSFQFQDAPVSGSGTLSISDGSSLFTAAISWDDVDTFGSSGALNTSGLPNLSDFSYSGSNAALQELADGSGGEATASFQFVPSESLSQLDSGDVQQETSYSGTVMVAVPESANTGPLVGAALIVLVLAARLRRFARI